MKRALVCQAILATFLTGCKSTTTHDEHTEIPEAPAAAEDKGDKELELRDLERKLEIARARLTLAHLELSATTTKLQAGTRHASAEIGLAKAHLARFQEAETPNRIASEKLDLQAAQDRAAEAAEELTQIEIMYEGQNLDDLTAEIVVSRGRRRAELATRRLAIMQNEINALEGRELPEEADRLTLAVDKAVAALAQAEAEAEVTRNGKAIAIQEKENEIEQLEAKIEALRKEMKP